MFIKLCITCFLLIVQINSKIVMLLIHILYFIIIIIIIIRSQF